jgi:thioredoxin-like negative regulator of GroEL
MVERIILLTVFFILAGLFSFRHRITRKNLNIQLPKKFSNSNSLPTVIYFWTDQCVQCKNSQKPALKSLQDKYAKFNLVSIDALTEKELVSKFKIKTVPSTVIFAADGKSRFINNGFIDEKELSTQIHASIN